MIPLCTFCNGPSRAHNRVMSIAILEKQLAVSSTDQVVLRTFLNELCASIGASLIDDADRVSLARQLTAARQLRTSP